MKQQEGEKPNDNAPRSEKKTDDREKDIQAMCKGILAMYVVDTGDRGDGGMCPLCGINCSWKADISEIQHDPGCIYLIAKDLKTNL